METSLQITLSSFTKYRADQDNNNKHQQDNKNNHTVHRNNTHNTKSPSSSAGQYKDNNITIRQTTT